MTTKNFRAEFLREKSSQEWLSQKYLHDDMDCPTFEVVFRDPTDGKHYAMEYYHDSNHGIDTFDGASNDDTFECYEVEEKKTMTTEWVKK